MADKQIIIDGVDVSGCDCYCDGKCLCEYNEINRKIIRYYSCNKFPNCYYKQLKRSEAQCEAMFVSHTDLEKKYKAKEQECEELKKTSCKFKNYCTCDTEKLKQTLTEIKDYCNKYPQNSIGFKQQILQKISECEGNDGL